MWRPVGNFKFFASVNLEVLIVDLRAAIFRLEKHLHNCGSAHDFWKVLELEKAVIYYAYWAQHRIAAPKLTISDRQVLRPNILDFHALIDLKVKNFAPPLNHFRKTNDRISSSAYKLL